MKLGFIGCGNMAGAIMGGILAKKEVTGSEICASDVSAQAMKNVREKYGIQTEENNAAVAKQADILILAVKPNYVEEVIGDIREAVRPETIVVTLAPGKTLAWLAERFGSSRKIIRTMPNTPALAGAGMTALCPNEQVTEEEMAAVKALFESFGEAEVVPEKLMDTVTGVSGSSPAFVFLFLEALADAAVAEGMPRAQAYKFAAQTVYGSAKLMLETGKHPGELKDMVCSPGGTTIEGVAVLEECAFRSSVIEAVRAAAEKSRQM